MVEDDGRDGESSILEEGDYLRVLGEVVIEGVLRLVVMEIQLRLLVAMVMVLCIGGFPEAEHADSITNSHRDHDGLHPGRVVEHGGVVCAVPVLGRAASLRDESAEGVVLDDAGAEDVEAGVGDGDRGAVARG